MNIKPIETVYKGYRFRSRLEARWAVFFDACGVDWEYEPEGYDLGDGIYYLPDFLLHGVTIHHGCFMENCDVYVEVKGNMTLEDSKKILRFVELSEKTDSDGCPEITAPVLVVGRIPDGYDIYDIDRFMADEAYGSGLGPRPFNFETIDNDYFAAYPGVGKDGVFQLFGGDSSYTWYRNDYATLAAFNKARQARFEHGETPQIRRF